MAARASFGRFELDLESGTLTRDGVRIRLQPQPARVLVLLVQQAGSIVPRETLRQQVWPDGTFVDFERGLNFCIAQIRSALGDSAESPRFVETLPRRGYRFIAPVQPLVPHRPRAADARPADSAPDVGATSRRRHWRVGAAVGGILLAVVALAIGVASRGGREPIRVAVVPFDNETGRDTFDAVAVAVADATVARLASPERVGRLSVIGNSAALRKPRTFRDLKAIGREVGADYLVLAQMKADANAVRLIAHLIRISDESHLWAQTFDRPAFTLDVQAEIAEAIASAVVERLSQGPSQTN